MAPKQALALRQDPTCPPGRSERLSHVSNLSATRLAILLVSLGLSLLTGVASIFADEVRADHSETRSESGITRRTYAGDVRASFQHSRIEADSAVVSTDSRQYSFYQNVAFWDDRYLVYADRVIYDAANQTADLSGHVSLADADCRLSAAQVTYHATTQTIEASGDVHISLPENQGEIKADRWFRDATSDSTSGSGDVRFTQAEAETLTIASDRFSSGEKGNRTLFTGSVSLRQGQWRGNAHTATIHKQGDRVVLKGETQLARPRSETDSTSTTADKTVMITEASLLRGMELTGSSRIDIQREEEAGHVSTAVSADTSRLAFDGGDLTDLAAFGNVRIVLAGPDSTFSQLDGEDASVRLTAGEPDRVHVNGSGDLHHASGSSDLRAHITGQGVAIDLVGSQVRAIRVDSNAVCEIQGDHPARLSGDRLHLVFEAGRLAKAEVKGRVQGRYQTGKTP